MSKIGCVALALLLVGCDRAQTFAPIEPATPINFDSYSNYELVIGPDWNAVHFSTTAVIGQDGGRLALGFHELIVPAQAVQRPTVFRMTAKPGLHVVLDLTATDRVSGEPVTKFPRPLELRMSYRFLPLARAQQDRLVVLWLKDDATTGELVPVPTVVSPLQNHISGTITHFSQYAMGMN